MLEDDGLSSTESRRSFLKKGVLASGVGVGLAGCSQIRGPLEGADESDSATETDDGDGGGKALMFNSEFRGGAQFRVVSPVIEQHPKVEGVQEGNVWSDYNTRILEYLNVDEDVTFFPAHDAQVQEGQVYELHENFTLFADDTNDEGIIDVEFTPVGEDEVFDEDFRIVEDGGGKALVRWNNYRPGAALTLISGVVEWSPGDELQEADILSEYNTRFAEWLNTGADFQIYLAQDATFNHEATYRMTDEFDVTDPEGNLLTVDLERVERTNGTDEATETNGDTQTNTN